MKQLIVELTIHLYRVNPYQKEFDASVTRIEPKFIVLDQTCFFPQGGGQAGDKGQISGNRVENTIIEGEEIRHIVEDTTRLTPGQVVHGLIDWERRHRIMRLHSAAHLVYYVMQEVFGSNCKPASSGMLDELKDRSDYTFSEPLDRTKLAAVEDKVNQLIISGLPITHSIDQGSEDRLLWKVAPYPAMACGGTHVRNTSEIGRILLKRGSKPGRGRERIELTLA